MLIQLGSGQPEALGDHFCAHTLVELHSVVSLADQRAERLAELGGAACGADGDRSAEHTSELQSLMRISYAVVCLKNITYHRLHKKTTHYKYKTRDNNEHNIL